jgi:hypothetical protein
VWHVSSGALRPAETLSLLAINLELQVWDEVKYCSERCRRRRSGGGGEPPAE